MDSYDDSDYLSGSAANIERKEESVRVKIEGDLLKTSDIPPPPFTTPEKLKPVEYILREFPGSQTSTLRLLAVALARDAIFGRSELAAKTLSGRNGTQALDPEKLEYIKAIVRSRVPNKSPVEFEDIWSLCRTSLSKSCQGIRSSLKKKRIQF